MIGNKNHSKLLIPILLLFLSNSGLLFSQQFAEGNININSDYKIFRDKPENNLFPHLQTSTYDVYDLLKSTIDLLYTKLDQLCTDSLFLIDTIYFHEKSHFKDFNNYRRSFTYDKFNRIKTVVAEAYKDSHWVTHQITDVSYNSSNKVEQINHIRYQKSFDDSLIIKNEFDSNGLITKEIGESLDSLKKSWNREWLKSYHYEDGKLIGYKIEKQKKSAFDSDSAKYKYNNQGLPIQCVEYVPKITAFDSIKFTWEYNEDGKLITRKFFSYDLLGHSSENQTNYYYNKSGQLLKEIEIEKDEFDQYSRKQEKMYYYNSSGLLDSIKYLSKIVKGEIDSVVGYGDITFEYDSSGYILGYTTFATFKNNISGGRTTFRRDEHHNIIFIQDEKWNNVEWVPKNSTKIIYKRKRY